MTKTLQIDVNPMLCASQERAIFGELKFDELKQIQQDIEPSSAPIIADVMFSKEGKFVVLTGRIAGDLVLQCAACLEPTVFKVDVDVKLAVINDEARLSLVPEGYEPYLFAGDSLLMSEVIESEVVMVLPSIARHEVCPVELPKNSTGKDFKLKTDVKKNPFEALGSLKKKH
ncbi:MAG: nucleic acid-binding protein [Cycloclasticus sp. symbiont of Poecilosclerida sp. N]|nr:MAG: nucleic acid-binding protein [Cycloclasticus sp. symbiont of Poecilosclerida sp. N]